MYRQVRQSQFGGRFSASPINPAWLNLQRPLPLRSGAHLHRRHRPALRDAGLNVKDICDLTGFPEMLDGRVKTLHPRVHGGLLFVRGNAEHEAAAAAHGILPIDMVIVNLYAFKKPQPSPASPSATSSKTSTLAAPPWSAPPLRTSKTSPSSPTLPTTLPSSRK